MKLKNVLCALSLLAFLVPPGQMREPFNNSSSSPAYEKKEEVPIVVALSIPDVVVFNKPFVLSLSVTPQIDMPNTSVEISLPPESQLISGSLSWTGDIPKNNRLSIDATIKIVQEGQFKIEGRALSRQPGFTFGKTDKIFVNSSPAHTEISRSEFKPNAATEKQIMTTRSIPSGNLTHSKGYQKPGGGQLPVQKPGQMTILSPGQGQIQIKGYFLYQNFLGSNIPERWIRVQFWESDFLGDDLLGQTLTDSDGYFESDPITNSEGIGGKLDIYVRFKTEDGIDIEVVNSGGSVWYCQTETKPDVPDGWVDFGYQEITGSSTGAYEVFDYLEDGWEFWDNLGYNHGLVTAKWYPGSTDGTYVETNNGYKMHVIDGDQMDEDVLLHEYGHSIMYGIFGAFPPNTGGTWIWATGHYTLEKAWNEGWAAYASSIVHDDRFYDDTTDQEVHRDLESQPDGSEWDGGGTGDTSVSAVNTLLWDIYDSHDDNRDTISDGSANIFDVFRYYTVDGHHIYTINQFWDGWFSRNHDNLAKINAVYFDHGIDKNSYPSLTITAPNSGGWCSGGVSVTASASDVDGAVSSVKFQYSLDNTNWYDIGEDTSAAEGWSIAWDARAINDPTVWVRAKAYDGMEYSDWDPSDSSFGIDNIDPSASVVVNSGATYTTSTSVNLDLTASDASSGLKDVCYSNDGSSWSGWDSFASTKAWTLSAGDGTKFVYYQARDNALNTRLVTDDIVLDTTLPSATISISNGATYATSTSVTLYLTASDAGSGLKDVRYSNGSIWSDWEAFTSTKAWILGDGDGTKTVYYQARDYALNTRQVSDDILLDTTLPSATISISNGATYATSTSVTLYLTASDTGSGLKDVRYSNDGSSWSDWETFTSTKAWTMGAGDGTKTVYYQARDNALNTRLVTDDIVLDSTPPGSVSNLYSTSHTVSTWSNDNTVEVAWTDATAPPSGLDGYSILWDTTSNTLPPAVKNMEEAVQTTISPALAAGNSHYFHIRSVDNAGNWQSSATHFGPFWIYTPYTLTISTTIGGSVTAPGIGAFSPYSQGQVVSLVANNNSGYYFMNWTGDNATIANPTAANTTITMNGDYSVQANFVPLGHIAPTVKVALQGGSRPYPDGFNVPLTLRLYDKNTVLTSDNITTATPLYEYTTNASQIEIFNITQSTKMISFTVNWTCPNDIYIATLISPHNLINQRNGVTINSAQPPIDMGTLLEGNANEDTPANAVIINGADFSVLSAAWNSQPGDANWDERADFDRNLIVSGADYSLMSSNWNKTAPQVIGGQGMQGIFIPVINKTVNMTLEGPLKAVTAGQEFEVPIRIDAGSQKLTVASAFIAFDPKYLEVVSITPGKTLDVELPGSYDNKEGKISLSRGSFSEVYDSFTMATIVFKAKATTSKTAITFDTKPPRMTEVSYAGESVLNNTKGLEVEIQP